MASITMIVSLILKASFLKAWAAELFVLLVCLVDQVSKDARVDLVYEMTISEEESSSE